ncbi:MAG TPA: hypothetical protein VGE97_08850 [Nitrososphaera sp.]
MAKPILLLDFDGVIHSYMSGWQGEDVVADPPVPGVFEWIQAALVHFDICIYSRRSSSVDGRIAMFDYIRKYAPSIVRQLQFVDEKPAAFLTIDDRCICFNGLWSDEQYDPASLLLFKPWNRT